MQLVLLGFVVYSYVAEARGYLLYYLTTMVLMVLCIIMFDALRRIHNVIKRAPNLFPNEKLMFFHYLVFVIVLLSYIFMDITFYTYWRDKTNSIKMSWWFISMITNLIIEGFLNILTSLMLLKFS